MDFSKLCSIAINAARSAGKIIQSFQNEDVVVELKVAGTSHASQVVTLVDRACEKEILSHLGPSCEEFDIAILTEETDDDGSRFERDFFWCVDPIDGTLPFINREPGFSVSIALVAKDGTPYIGAVYDPSKDVMYHAIRNGGAFVDGQALVIRYTNEFLTYVTDRSLRDTARAVEIGQILDETAKNLRLNRVVELAGAGSVLNAIRVLENGPACMLKFPKEEEGGGSVWDFAATACIFHELGLRATNYEGGQLDLNRQDGTFMNHEGVFYANL